MFFQASDQLPRVEVTNRPPAKDLSHIPTSVVEAFAAQGKRLTMASRFDEQQAQLSVHSRLPLTKEDVASVARPEVKPGKDGNGGQPAFDPDRVLRLDGAFHWNGDGFLQKGDCIIYCQPQDAYEDQLREATNRWLYEQDDPNTVRSHLDDLSRDLPYGRVHEKEDYPLGRLGDMIANPKSD